MARWKLITTEEEVEKCIEPLLQSYCERIRHRVSKQQIRDVVLDFQATSTFAYMNDVEPMGFLCIATGRACGTSFLHIWHGYMRRKYQESTGEIYKLTIDVMKEMDLDDLTMTFFNKKVGKAVSNRLLKEFELDLKFQGYFYLGTRQKEK